MDKPLLDFINRFRVGDGHLHTHSSMMSHLAGKFYMSGNDYDDFMRLYCTRLTEMGRDGFVCALAENPWMTEHETTIMPVLVDIDFKIPFNESVPLDRHFYTREHIDKIIYIYQSELMSKCQDIELHNLHCFVLEKTRPISDGIHIKDGFHLHFPFLFMNGFDIEVNIATAVRKRITDDRIFNNIPYFETADSGSFLDRDISKKHWLLYGGRKSLTNEAYTLTRIVNKQLATIELSEALENNTVYNTRDEAIVHSRTEDITWYLPYILSINHYRRHLKQCKSTCDLSLYKPNIRSAATVNNLRDSSSLAETLAETRALVNMLHVRRADNHNDWFHVGMILFDVCHGCLEGCDIWHEFSLKAQRRTHINEARCLYEWTRMTQTRRGSYTMASLTFLAAQDNPDEYRLFQTQRRNKTITESIEHVRSGTSDQAKLLYDKFSQEIVCASLEKSLWFYYDSELHRWCKTEKANVLYRAIDSYLIPVYMQNKRNLADDDGNKKEAYQKIITKLKSVPYKKQVIEECSHLFFVEKFYDRLDANPMLLGFTNGVLDLSKMVFRKGEPSDYISMTCGYNFEDFSGRSGDPDITYVLMFFKKLLPDEVRLWFYEYLGKILRGYNFDQKWLIMSGRGGNGKSACEKLITAALGGDGDLSYSGKFSPALLTGKEAESNAATPDLYSGKGKRIMFITEPKHEAKLNTNIIKSLTGEESITCRALFSPQTTYRPQFKFAFICNKVPRIDYDPEDEGIWRRILRVNFPSRFPEKDSIVPKSLNEQFQKRIFYRDSNFDARIPQLRPAMMWLMFDWYKTFMTRGRSMELPDDVSRTVEIYKEDSDVVLQFKRERLVQQQGEYIMVNDVYTQFVDWYVSCFGPASRGKAISRNELKSQLSQKPGFSEPISGRWMNWRLRTLDDDFEQENMAAIELNPA